VSSVRAERNGKQITERRNPMSEALVLTMPWSIPGTYAATDDEDTVTCISCHVVEADATAYEQGWQFDPPVCPDCLRWEAVDVDCC
jgi:hypothetical protein